MEMLLFESKSTISTFLENHLPRNVSFEIKTTSGIEQITPTQRPLELDLNGLGPKKFKIWGFLRNASKRKNTDIFPRLE